MAGGKEPMGASMVNNAPAVRVLLVDDNSSSLSATITMLQLFNYQVGVAKTPLEATSILRLNHESFDLVLSDLQLSMINALDLRKQLEDEFHIPVILMSPNDSTNIPKRSLNVGRPFFIEKPPTPDDLKTIKQYVISRKKETESLNYLKRKLLEEDDEESNINEEDYASLNPKKTKLTWTTALHNKFLEAIDAIGLDRVVPKKILEYMNVPGLTRVNIASHLQKYRIYLRRISEASGSMKHGMPQNLNESPFRSTFFWSQLHTLANNNLLLNYASSSNLERQAQEGASVSKINASDHGENNSNMPLVLNYPLIGLAGLSTQLGTKLNPPLNILESSYVISQSNNFTNYTTTQDNGDPSNGNQGDFDELFDLANDMNNDFMGLFEEGNQGDMSCFFNDDGFELANNMEINSNIQKGALNTDQIVENPLVEQNVITPTSDDISQVNEDYFVEQAHHDVITMPSLSNDQIVEDAFAEPAAANMSNLDNVFAQQILPIESSNNVLPAQNMLAIGEEVQNFDLPNIASPVLFQDWASNIFDGFALYGMDDLVSFLSSCDENNASNNQLP